MTAHQGDRTNYRITPEALSILYKHHLHDLLKRRIPNHSLFEAYVQYCYSPKHTTGEQLLEVRRDKREREAYAALNKGETSGQENEEEEDDDDAASDRAKCQHCGRSRTPATESGRRFVRETGISVLAGIALVPVLVPLALLAWKLCAAVLSRDLHSILYHPLEDWTQY